MTLNCTSPRDNPASVTWRRQSSCISNESSVLARIEEGRISRLDTRGRLSLNRTVRNNILLVIYGILQSDSGTYSCSVDVGYEKQHVTVLLVRGTGIKLTVIIGVQNIWFFVYVLVMFILSVC